MRKIYYILFSIFISGCYDDDNSVVTSDDVAHNTSELTTIIKSMSQHNAAFDNIIDSTSCFSLAFPYQVYINSQLSDITSISDITEISEDDQIEIVFPLNVNFYNYEIHEAFNQTDFNLVKNTCSENFNTVSNPCLDIVYPIQVKEFNDLTENFQTYQLNNDKEIYLHFDNLHDNDVYEIEYPIFVTDTDSNTLRIDSNNDFVEVFNNSLQNCN